MTSTVILIDFRAMKEPFLAAWGDEQHISAGSMSVLKQRNISCPYDVAVLSREDVSQMHDDLSEQQMMMIYAAGRKLAGQLGWLG